MMTEYKYYFDKINALLKEDEISEILFKYLSNDEKYFKNNPNSSSNCTNDVINPGEDHKQNILKLISRNENSSFSKNYLKKILNKFDNIESQKDNIMNKDIENQQENFKKRLEMKSLQRFNSDNKVGKLVLNCKKNIHDYNKTHSNNSEFSTTPHYSTSYNSLAQHINSSSKAAGRAAYLNKGESKTLVTRESTMNHNYSKVYYL